MLLLTVFVDLITAVGVGLIIAGFLAVQRRAQDELDQIVADEEQSNESETVVKLAPTLSYAFANKLAHSMETKRHNANAVVITFDAAQLKKIDTSAAIAIRDVIENTYNDGITVHWRGGVVEVDGILNAVKALNKANRI